MNNHEILIDMGFTFRWKINCYVKGDKYITGHKVDSLGSDDLRLVALNDNKFCALGPFSESRIREVKLREAKPL